MCVCVCVCVCVCARARARLYVRMRASERGAARGRQFEVLLRFFVGVDINGRRAAPPMGRAGNFFWGVGWE